ncbi:MAG: histidine--tRNA ligase [Bacilli bacterium]
MIQNPKGTHDIFGNEMTVYQAIRELYINICSSYGFKEIMLPIFESSNLFQRGVGESSDVVRKEMYTFLDKGGRSITLRPEFTAGIIRSFVQNKMYVNEELPVKLFYHGPTFRYERPQSGRYRQFHQLGVECIGLDSYLVDTEIVALGYDFLVNLGLKDDIVLKINTLGDEETRTNYRAALKEYFAKYIDKMCDDCKSRFELNPLRILDCKVPEDREIIKSAPKISDYLSENSKTRFNKLLAYLNELEIPYEVDESLVRGLDYYSETVFEFHYISNEKVDIGAIGAGGHYSSLVKELDGPDMHGVGFSFGAERLITVVSEKAQKADLDFDYPLPVYIMPIGNEKVKEEALSIAIALRQSGFASQMCYEDVKINNMFKRAERKKAKVAIILGEDEISKEIVQVKNLSTKEQVTVSYQDLIGKLEEILCEGEHHECHCHDDGCCCHDHDKE